MEKFPNLIILWRFGNFSLDSSLTRFVPGTNFSSSSRESKINCGEPLNIYLREDLAVVEEIVTGRILGSISFDEDELYYVVLPLLEDPKVDAHATIIKVDSGRRNKERIHVAIELTIPKDLTDTPVSNEKLIKELLMK